MKVAKQILFALPVMFASLLFIVSPATAGIVKHVTPTQRIELVSAHPIFATITPGMFNKSNPIVDSMGCSCSACVKAKLQMEGKLPLASLL
ncbi:hypothetical protein NIES4101_59120 [Calothrix sp. NIES-4101]|nr:hypothetical protein NIES4101_59120 [Calothrix sp. NIES-4101]